MIIGKIEQLASGDIKTFTIISFTELKLINFRKFFNSDLKLPNGKSRAIGRKAIQPSLLSNDNDKPSEIDSANDSNGEVLEASSRLPSDRTSERRTISTRAASRSIRSQPKEPTFELTPPSGPFKFQPDSYREAKFEAEKAAG